MLLLIKKSQKFDGIQHTFIIIFWPLHHIWLIRSLSFFFLLPLINHMSEYLPDILVRLRYMRNQKSYNKNIETSDTDKLCWKYHITISNCVKKGEVNKCDSSSSKTNDIRFMLYKSLNNDYRYYYIETGDSIQFKRKSNEIAGTPGRCKTRH